MTGIAIHLKCLVDDFQDALVVNPSEDEKVLDKWVALRDSIERISIPNNETTIENDQIGYPTVLDIFHDCSASPTPEAHDSHTCISHLLRKSIARPLLDSLHRILLLDQPNEHIADRIAEIVGFGDIELVVDILNKRSQIASELHKVLHPRTPLQSLRPSETSRYMELQLKEPLHHGTTLYENTEVFPNIYSASSSSATLQGNLLTQFGHKYTLPIGTVRNVHEDCEEVVVPPAKIVPPGASEKLIQVHDLSTLLKRSFPGYKTLNRIQSIIYPTAYGTNENLLVCAPTGAGKTDVAMLTILRVINLHCSTTFENGDNLVDMGTAVDRNSFKIIYVAPLKALASEIVRKLSKRLIWLSIVVRELTGDMQLSKAEIAQTQIIVTTPEKWDVITRKPTGEGELASSLKLLIIDEVHLLNEERGAVIETIVARTLRQVESTQSMIRIVGLSATLPNYADVAEFLCVSPYKGLFYFDASFRPVPLEQHFIGIKGKPGSIISRRNLDRVTFRKVSDLVAHGHQVMVFVHARKETVKAALAIREAAMMEGVQSNFICEDHPRWSLFRSEIGHSKNKEMKLLFDSGLGIHHAGMLRSDRSLTEKLFGEKAIKVLCCTATLAWGINLPAHAVIIKGTRVYDSLKGTFVDLSILDVLQIFGRAGRPGLESSGEAYICTTGDKLPLYLEAVTSQIPIESRFQTGMIDALNAEISLGTVANVAEAIRWLGYTYLFVRMKKNPKVYGIALDRATGDPLLIKKREELVQAAADRLVREQMITFNNGAGAFSSTDLGVIAAKYYIRYTSIEVFRQEFKATMSDADVLRMLSMSTEFDQIQVRESEDGELKRLMERVPCEVQGGADTSHGKVNVLLQGHISREQVEDFALVSDTAYVAQNGARIARALLEIAISYKWANVAAVLMDMSKAIEQRLWPYDQPLRQFRLRGDVLYGLQRWADDWSISQLAALDAPGLGNLIHLNEHHGHALLNAVKQFPAVDVDYDLRPLSHDVLQIEIRIKKSFQWNSKVHGTGEPFWLWIEDDEGSSIHQLTHFLFRQSIDLSSVTFVICIPPGTHPPSLTARCMSDRWVGSEEKTIISLSNLVMPSISASHTPLLDLPYLSLSILGDLCIEKMIPHEMEDFKQIQTHAFWSLFSTRCNTLLCAPAGSGKLTMSRILVGKTVYHTPIRWILFVTPRKHMAFQIASEFKRQLGNTTHLVECEPDRPDKWDHLDIGVKKVVWVTSSLHLLRLLADRDPLSLPSAPTLVICDHLELLDATYELGISLLRYGLPESSTRFVGFSSSLDDCSDLADWLGVDSSGLHSFRPQDQDCPLVVSFKTFTISQSSALLKVMTKSAHNILQNISADDAVLVFLPSRGQCKAVALDLLTHRTLDSGTERGFLPPNVDDDRMRNRLSSLLDVTLVDIVSRGVGFFHEGIQKGDRQLMLDLFSEGYIRVMIVPRESCWFLPICASVVIVMGTQHVRVDADGTNHQVCEYPLADIVRMQSRAARHKGTSHFYVFCQAETKDALCRFLSDGLPLESEILRTNHFATWLGSQRNHGTSFDKKQLLYILSFTYLFRRLASNPTYYGCLQKGASENLEDIFENRFLSGQRSHRSHPYLNSVVTGIST